MNDRPDTDETIKPGSPTTASMEGADPTKPFLEAIDAAGIRAQRVALILLSILVVLFVGFILPSIGIIDKVRSNRAELESIDRKIEIHERKAKARKQLTRIARKDALSPLLARRDDLSPLVHPSVSPLVLECRQFEKTTFADEIKKANRDLDSLEKKISDERAKQDRKQSLEESIRPGVDNIEGQLKDVEERFKPLQASECLSFFDPGSDLRSIRDRLASIKLSAAASDIKDRLNSSTDSRVPLYLLGIFGIKLEGGPKEARVPLVYLPLFWSTVLLALLAYLSYTRGMMLNLYARALRRTDPATFPDRLGALSRSRWWWLAPLPKINGKDVRAQQLRHSLGWYRFELVAILGVTSSLLLLIGMQAGGAIISLKLAPALVDNPELAIITAMISVMATLNIILAVRWFWPWRSVPDYEANQEADWYYRRTIVSMFLLGLVGALLSRFLIWSVVPTDRSKPRFRRKRVRRFVEAAPHLEVGFYRNARTQVLHYVSFLRFPTIPTPRKRRKRHRIRLLRIELTRRHAQIGWSNGDARKLEPVKRRRKTAFEWKPPKPDPRNPRQRIIRGVARLNQDPEFFVPVAEDELLTAIAAKPEAARMIQSRGGTKPPQGTQELSEPPRLFKAQTPFAVEQEVLRILGSSRSSDTGAGEDRAFAVERACRLLKAAIELGRPQRSYIRLYDLLAVIALRNKRNDMLDWLIEVAKEHPRPEIAARARRWSGEIGKWRARWEPGAVSYGYKKDRWSGLPM